MRSEMPKDCFEHSALSSHGPSPICAQCQTRRNCPEQGTGWELIGMVGAQANVWTEYISDEATVEYMLLPRLAALAETVWSPPQLRDWGSFLHRLKEQLPHLDARNLTYRPLGM